MKRVSFFGCWRKRKKMRNAYKKSSGEGSGMAEVELD